MSRRVRPRSLVARFGRVKTDPTLAVTVDTCETSTGLVQQVIAHGSAELLPLDVPRGKRKLSRYLGLDETHWDARFGTTYTMTRPTAARRGYDYAPLSSPPPT